MLHKQLWSFVELPLHNVSGDLSQERWTCCLTFLCRQKCSQSQMSNLLHVSFFWAQELWVWTQSEQNQCPWTIFSQKDSANNLQNPTVSSSLELVSLRCINSSNKLHCDRAIITVTFKLCSKSCCDIFLFSDMTGNAAAVAVRILKETKVSLTSPGNFVNSPCQKFNTKKTAQHDVSFLPSDFTP